MEARVLTLFDDEDFLPKTEAPKKPVKKVTAAPKAAVDPAAAPADPETIAETAETPVSERVPESTAAAGPAVMTVLSPQESQPLELPPVAAQEEMPSSFISIELPGTPAAVPDAGEEEVPAAATGETLTDDPKAADEELNRQILSELVQQDYTALIHRDYPFDVQQASVVKKDKPAARFPEPAAEPPAIDDEVFEEVVPLPEWNLDKKYYTIGEVAQLFAVNTSHIRFWTNEFKLKPRTTRKGDRLYSPRDIAELRLIHHLVKEKKHTIKGAREKLKAEKTGVNQKLDLKESLTGLRDMLQRIHEQL